MQTFQSGILSYLEGNRYFWADLMIDLTLSRPALESQLDFLWWTPLKANDSNKSPIFVLFFSPVSDVEHSGALGHDHLELVLQTVVRDALQRPVPVVVIKLKNVKLVSTPVNLHPSMILPLYLAELFSAAEYFVPLPSCKSHSHVVLGGNPLCHLRLQIKMY